MYGKLRRIEGWLSRTDFELLKEISTYQNERDLDGAVVEIGVHHGKSFIPLAKLNGGSRSYAIDIFENQNLNLDQSGSGNFGAFMANLRRFGIAADAVVVDKRPSDAVTPADILDRVGPVRLFHIDGGHHVDAVMNDIRLALDVTAPHGVIVVDDVFRPEWPEVTMGVFGTTLLQERGFVPFAIGFNKTFFCAQADVDAYQDALGRNRLLAILRSKVYRVGASPIFVYQRYPLPEWGLAKLAMWVMEMYFPGLYLAANPRGLHAGLRRALGR